MELAAADNVNSTYWPGAFSVTACRPEASEGRCP